MLNTSQNSLGQKFVCVSISLAKHKILYFIYVYAQVIMIVMIWSWLEMTWLNCLNFFSNSSSLKWYWKRIHSKLRYFSCKLALFGFSSLVEISPKQRLALQSMQFAEATGDSFTLLFLLCFSSLEAWTTSLLFYMQTSSNTFKAFFSY